MNQQEIAKYLALPWSYTVQTSIKGEGNAYTVRVNELPEVQVEKGSLEEAMKALKPVLVGAIKDRIERGELIPEPLLLEQCKGKVAYRTTPERHYRLASEAKRRGMSLSRVIDYCLDKVL